MTDIITQEDISIRYSEIDFDKKLKPSALLNFFQDIASDNAERLGFGVSAIYPQNLMWFLLKYRIEFEQYPVDIQKLTLKTRPRGYQKLFAYRNFELCHENKVLARASSMWSLINFKTMGLVHIEQAIHSPYMMKFEKTDEDLSYGKIPTLTDVHLQKEFEVRYNDIDVNQHANNGNYIIWALEPLLYDFKAQHQLKTVDISFKKEIKFGEKLISKVQIIDDKTTVHQLSHAQSGEDLCLLCCSWI